MSFRILRALPHGAKPGGLNICQPHQKGARYAR